MTKTQEYQSFQDRGGPRPLRDRAANQDLVPEPSDEVEEGAPGGHGEPPPGDGTGPPPGDGGDRPSTLWPLPAPTGGQGGRAYSL